MDKAKCVSVHVDGASSVHTRVNVPCTANRRLPVYTYLQYVIFRLYNRKPWLHGIVEVRLIKRKQKAKNVLDKPYIFRIHLLFLVCPNRKLLQLGLQIWVIILFVLAIKIQTLINDTICLVFLHLFNRYNYVSNMRFFIVVIKR